MRDSAPLSFYEFFCGGGMARAGLGRAWNCLFANDHDEKKGDVYRANWGADALRVSDVASRSGRAICRAAPISCGRPFPARTFRLPAPAPDWRDGAPARFGRSIG